MENYRLIKDVEVEDLLVYVPRAYKEDDITVTDSFVIAVILRFLKKAGDSAFIHPDVFKKHRISNYKLNKTKDKLEKYGIITIEVKKNKEGVPMRLFTLNKNIDEFINV